MRQEDFDRDWEAASKELLTEMKAWRKAHGKATLTEIEDELDRRMQQLRGEMLEDMAQASDLADVGRWRRGNGQCARIVGGGWDRVDKEKER